MNKIIKNNTKQLYLKLREIIIYKTSSDNVDLMILVSALCLAYAKDNIMFNFKDFHSTEFRNKINSDELYDAVSIYMSIELWNELEKITYNVSLNDLYNIVLYISDNRLTNFSLPAEINNLVNTLLHINKTDKVCQMYNCNGHFIHDNFKSIKENSIYCIEYSYLNRIILYIIRYMARINLNVINNDNFWINSNYEIKFSKIFINTITTNKIYPYHFFNYEDYNKFFKFTHDTGKKNIEGLSHLYLAVNHLAYDGVLVALTLSGQLENINDREMRKFLVENKLVKTVISLPPRLSNFTGVDLSLLILSHNCDHVRMVDAREYFNAGRRLNELAEEHINKIIEETETQSKNNNDISIETIAKNDYNLLPKKYFEIIPDFYNGIVFEKIIKEIRRGAGITANQLDEMISDKETNYQYLTLANINNNIIDKKLKYLKNIDQNLYKYCINNGDILLSKIGSPYKIATFYSDNNAQTLVNGNIYIIKLDTELANPHYIKMLFESELGEKLLQNISVGTVMSTISVNNLKKLIIPLPDIKIQNKIVDNYITMQNEIAELYDKINQKKEELKQYLTNTISENYTKKENNDE